MDKNIKFYHKDWIGNCIIKDDIIYRNNIEGESGNYSIKNSELLIKWNNWEDEYFININDKVYIEKKYFENLKIYYLLKNNCYLIVLYDIKNNYFLENNNIVSLRISISKFCRIEITFSMSSGLFMLFGNDLLISL